MTQEEQLDDNGQQSEPPGFHLLQLAFADDIRDKGIKQTKFCRKPGQDEDGEPGPRREIRWGLQC